MRRLKIVLIGAGSSVFTQGLVADFVQAPELGPILLALVDVDAKTLDAITKVVRNMVAHTQADIEVCASVDRRDVLPGADVVVTTIAVGGRRSWEADIAVPRQFGIYQPVGDTTMPGGISRALRMIPAMLEIADDVHHLCPDAYFFNYSNPMTAICTAIDRYSDAKVTGLCHGVIHVEHYLARFLGVASSQVRSLGVGLNHLTFLYDVRVNGQNAWPFVDERIAQQSAEFGHDYHSASFAQMDDSLDPPIFGDEPFSWTFYRRFGAIPAVLDRHVTEFFPERFRTGDYYGKKLGVDAYSIEQVIAVGERAYENLFDQADGRMPLREDLFQRNSGEHEQLVDILLSLFHDGRQTYSVNLPNRGAVPNLPTNAILELPAVATSRGFHALYIDDFPDMLAAIIRRRLTVVDLTVEAAVHGNKDVFVEALLADGSVTGEATAHQLADALLAAHRAHLPQFSAHWR